MKLFFFFKRLSDILFSMLGICILIPFIIIIKILYIFFGDTNSIFYIHERVGKNGKKFKMYKFRTMVINSDELLVKMLEKKEYQKQWKEFHKFENDPRITNVGKILRRLSMDELPQMFNVFIGDMSLIGPRPLTQEEIKLYRNKKKLLLSVRPGLTGWWACNGRSCISNKQRMALELYYVENISFLLDAKIFFKTIVKIIQREGAK